MTEKQKTFLDLFWEQKPYILGIITATALFFWQVVLPLQKINLQLVEIQKNITESQQKYDSILAEHKQFSSKLDIIQTKLDAHLNQK